MEQLHDLTLDTGVWAAHYSPEFEVQGLAGPVGARTVTVYVLDLAIPALYEDAVSYTHPASIDDLQVAAKEAVEAYVRDLPEEVAP